MTQHTAFRQPIPYETIDVSQYEALLLPGGDAPRVRQYLDSTVLRSKVLQFWHQDKLIGAICQGVLVLARTIDPQSGRGVIYGHKVTAPPKSLDRFGYLIDRWLLKHGYVMYSQCVGEEVRGCLQHPGDLSNGPTIFKPYVVRDETLITSRWYLDAELFARSFANELAGRQRPNSLHGERHHSQGPTWRPCEPVVLAHPSRLTSVRIQRGHDHRVRCPCHTSMRHSGR
jgi:putative intracellular protease/amidase